MKKNMSPEEIQKLSFRIVHEQFGNYLDSKTDEEKAILTRVAHATADVDYAKTFIFHPQAVTAGLEAIKSGKNIITDVEMVRVGIRSRDIKGSGNQVLCLLNDREVIETARKMNTTRSQIAIRHAAPLMEGGLVAIGNAPTALFELCNLMRQGKACPALVVGVPIGFVGAAESKEELVNFLDTSFPFITNRGQRGGSAVAASIVNALIKLAFSQGD